MPLDYTNPSTLQFLKENFEKEQEKRLLWFTKNKDELIKRATFGESYADIRTADVARHALEICLPSLMKDYEIGKSNCRKKPIQGKILHSVSSLKYSTNLEEDKLESAESVTSEPVMLPVEPNVKNILHQPLPIGGRHQYLKARKYKIPEDKYYDNPTSNSIFGWRLSDSKFSHQPPKYGQYCSFIHNVNSRSGPQPDPAYYQIPPKDPYFKCF